MNKNNFPFIAAAIGFILTIVLLKGSGVRADGKTTFLPLLTLLLMSEFGAILTAIGTYLGLKQFFSTKKLSVELLLTVFCAFLCLQFVVQGFALWPSK